MELNSAFIYAKNIMKKLSGIGRIIGVMMVSFFSSVVILAQDSIRNIDTDININAFDRGPFYTQLWFWVVIGLVFLLILIALMRGSGGKNNNYKEDV